MPFAPQRILCAVDLSEASENVLRWAALFARTFQARVEVVHAMHFEPPPYFTESQVRQFAAQAGAEREGLNAALARLTERALGPGVAYRSMVREGDPRALVLQETAEGQADLLVMGSHGRSGVVRLMLGSVAENVLREVRRPTLIVKAAPPARLQRVLCPVSFTDLGRQCLDLSSQLTAAFGARLEVMHAAEAANLDVEAVQRRLCQWMPGDVRGRCEIAEVVRQGDAAEQIVLLARERHTDLIVLGAQHRPFLEFVTLGTTTVRVMRHSPASVLIHPAQSA